jgi:quercetin dioxygenase-like cupin family protein
MRKLIGLALAVMLMGDLAIAQQPAPTTQPAVKRTPLQRFDVPGTGQETVIGMAELMPNVSVGRHTHPGPAAAYILEGELILSVTGQPEQTFKAGESFQLPAGVVHDERSGPTGLKLIVTYVIEKGKPLASPVTP